MADLAQLAQQLTGSDAANKRTAAAALAKLGPDAAEAAAAMVQAVGSDDDELQSWLTNALESLGPPPVAQIGLLATSLMSDQADVAYWAATLLGRLESQAAPAVAALGQLLAGNKHLSARQQAARALGAIGPAAASAAAALEHAAASDDKRLARLSTEALAKVRPA